MKTIRPRQPFTSGPFPPAVPAAPPPRAVCLATPRPPQEYGHGSGYFVTFRPAGPPPPNQPSPGISIVARSEDRRPHDGATTAARGGVPSVGTTPRATPKVVTN